MAFQPGQSGNPGGRPKTVLANGLTLREMARQHTEDALNALVHVVTKGESETARVTAAQALLDRGWGKPTQPLSGDDQMPPIAVTGAPDAVVAWLASQQLPDDADTAD
jgi:hypothetical protein